MQIKRQRNKLINDDYIHSAGLEPGDHHEFRNKMKFMTPDMDQTQEEDIDRDDEKPEKPQPEEEKAFMDGWGDVDFSKTEIEKNSPKKEDDQSLNASNVKETFEKFGLKGLASNGSPTELNKGVVIEENPKTCKEQSVLFEFMKKIPDYGYLIDSNICFPDDFFG